MTNDATEYVVHLRDGEVNVRTDGRDDVHTSTTATTVLAYDASVEGGHLFLWRGNERVAVYAPGRWLDAEVADEPDVKAGKP